MPGMMQMCASCNRSTDDLTHCKSTDEYLCEPCIMTLAQQHYDDNRLDNDTERFITRFLDNLGDH